MFFFFYITNKATHITFINKRRGHKRLHSIHPVLTFLANDLLGLRFTCDRHHLHQQPAAPLPDQRHHLLVSHLHDIYSIYLRYNTKTEERIFFSPLSDWEALQLHEKCLVKIIFFLFLSNTMLLKAWCVGFRSTDDSIELTWTQLLATRLQWTF